MSVAKRESAKIIVITDDFALPLGKIRIRPKGSDGGHNGLKSIIDCLRTPRLPSVANRDSARASDQRYQKIRVEKFSKADFEIVDKVLETSAEAIRTIIREGVEKAMAHAKFGVRILGLYFEIQRIWNFDIF